MLANAKFQAYKKRSHVQGTEAHEKNTKEKIDRARIDNQGLQRQKPQIGHEK